MFPPKAEQWTVIKHLHDSPHLGGDSLYKLISHIFIWKGLSQTTKEVTRACELCVPNDQMSHPIPPPLLKPAQHQGSFRGEEWQIESTQMPSCKGFKYLLVLIDTFTGWIEDFLTCNEKALEVSKFLLMEIIPRFGLLRSLQSDYGPSFTAKVTQQAASALGIRHHLYPF